MDAVKPISMQQAKQLIAYYHYLGAKGFRCSYAYGLFIDDALKGAIVFHSVSAPETVVGAFGLGRTEQQGIFEIGRLVLHPQLNGENWGSFLVGRSIKQLRRATEVRAIITYADSSLHVGAVYQASNFKYCGLSAPKNDFVVNGKIRERGKIQQHWFGTIERAHGEWKPRPQKHRYVMLFDKTLSLKWKEVSYPKLPELYKRERVKKLTPSMAF